MNSQFNYATFVELFLNDDEYAPSPLSQCPAAAELAEKISEAGMDKPISPPA